MEFEAGLVVVRERRPSGSLRVRPVPLCRGDDVDVGALEVLYRWRAMAYSSSVSGERFDPGRLWKRTQRSP
ncbi:hypothetical protein ACIRQQ_31005 [Streptomyces fuscichromogenes]|uniref:hypothetical protein n=1 Tax=Streptomyces fuscichromogenes TaxID=1324013 RepID=UPI0037F3C170